MTTERSRESSVAALVDWLEALELQVEQPDPYTVVATIPGTHRLTTTCSFHVGDTALVINAFVARNPDENHEAVYRWLLERNRRMYGVSFTIDHLGDIYLHGRVPLTGLNANEVDRLVGAIAQYSDESFNPILELGFRTSIEREWKWRIDNGLPTENLAAFAHLMPAAQPSAE